MKLSVSCVAPFLAGLVVGASRGGEALNYHEGGIVPMERNDDHVIPTDGTNEKACAARRDDGACQGVDYHNGGGYDVHDEGIYHDEQHYNGEDQTSLVLPPNASILDVLNPDILNNKALLAEIAYSLQRHELVVLRDAFDEDFAEQVWQDLYEQEDNDWEHYFEYEPDGFSFSHHNFYDPENFTPIMQQVNAIFNHPDSMEWIANLTGRVNTAPHSGSASRYFPGDFSMPHTDYSADRTVAYVWHLSYDWHRAWGGALYWCGEKHNAEAYVHATFNTLNLFSVTRYTEHMVTMVAPNVPNTHKRLAWNGWWRDDRPLDFANYPIEAVYDTHDKRLLLTADQNDALLSRLDIEDQVPDDMKRQQVLYEWRDTLWHELNAPRVNSLMVDLYDRLEEEESMYEFQAEDHERD